LGEIHHRVKNNLAVVSSLLRLQSRDAKDEFHRRMFLDAQDRIRSMALVHERLCHSDDLASVNVAEYVDGLADHLVQTQRGIGSRVVIEKHVESAHLSLDTAVPLGFLINELISNALKHAYTDRPQGTLCISFRPLDEKEYELLVKDDGTGFPEGVDFENPLSFGLSLVKLFTKQIDGEIKLLRDAGTEFRIRFSDRP
jgi:two-component sensor histidine kinase